MGYNQKNYPNLDENRKLFETINNTFRKKETSHTR